MTYIVMKSNPGFATGSRKICTLEHLFPSMDFLYNQYGLKPDDIIFVLHVATKDLPHWKGYKTPFKGYYSGTVEGFIKKAKHDCYRGFVARKKFGIPRKSKQQKGDKK